MGKAEEWSGNNTRSMHFVSKSFEKTQNTKQKLQMAEKKYCAGTIL